MTSQEPQEDELFAQMLTDITPQPLALTVLENDEFYDLLTSSPTAKLHVSHERFELVASTLSILGLDASILCTAIKPDLDNHVLFILYAPFTFMYHHHSHSLSSSPRRIDKSEMDMDITWVYRRLTSVPQLEVAEATTMMTKLHSIFDSYEGVYAHEDARSDTRFRRLLERYGQLTS